MIAFKYTKKGISNLKNTNLEDFIIDFKNQ
jgi:hypothetical protein